MPEMRYNLVEDSEDVLLGKDQVILVVKLELGTGILGEKNFVANLHIHRDAITVIVTSAFASSDDCTAMRLLLGGVQKDDTACGHLFSGRWLNNQSIAQWLKVQ